MASRKRRNSFEPLTNMEETIEPTTFMSEETHPVEETQAEAEEKIQEPEPVPPVTEPEKPKYNPPPVRKTLLPKKDVPPARRRNVPRFS